MAMRQIMIAKKIRDRNASIAELRTQIAGFETRKADLERAIEEAATPEEEQAVEEEVATYETELKAVEDRVTTLEQEVADLQAELDELNNSAPDNTPAPAAGDPEARNRQSSTQIRGGEARMNVRFKEMSFEQREALVKRNDVKEFMVQVRELAKASQQRAVSGSELTVPLVLLSMIRDNLHRYSKLIKRVNLVPVKGKARQNVMGAIPEAIWTEACARLNELELLFNQVEVDGYKVGGFIPICNANLEDSDENLVGIILDAISQSIGFAVDKAIIYGTGNKMPLGIVTRLAQASEPSNWSEKRQPWTDLRTSNMLKVNQAAGTPAEFFASLVLGAAAAKANYTTAGTKFWAMNTTTHAQLVAKLVSINAAGALTTAMDMTMPILGGDHVILEFIPDGDIVGGYGELYLLAERAGIQLAQSEHVRFIEDQTVFKGTARYDGEPVIGRGFVVININNANPTTSVAFAPDNANPEDSYLSALTIGNLTLAPTFNAATLAYATNTSNAQNAVTATAAEDGAKIEIKVNGSAVTNGQNATWTTGENAVEIKVTKGTTVRTYTVTVIKS